MLNLVQKFFSTERFQKEILRKNFSTYFFSLPEHQWLNTPRIKKHFEKTFEHLPSGVLNALMTKYPVNFITSEMMNEMKRPGMLFTNTVVVFPEFQKLLNSKKSYATAYIAHELALVLCELEEPKMESIMAEVEADKFVCDLGLSNELEEFLLMLDETIEKRVRLTYLTINHFTRGKDN